jgi:predicted component of viral defense system (DUF524 family)
MIEIKEFIEIPLDRICPLMCLKIHAYSKGENLMLIENEFEQVNEAKYQFFEGKSYLYELVNSQDWRIDYDKTSGVFTAPKIGNIGGFNPNTFVGTFQIPFINQATQELTHENIEIRSSKISYEKGINENDLKNERSEYQKMLEHIAAHSVELVLQYNVPIQQTFESSLEQLDDAKHLYQRFLFVRSLFKNQEFEESIQKIISNPATRWVTEEEERDIRSVRRFSAKNIRELTSRSNRMPYPNVVPGLNDVPLKITSSKKVESVDTPENRFVKHILESFLGFCEIIASKLENAKLVLEHKEVKSIAERIDNLLNQPFFKEINRPTSLRINSPVLQRRSGYRELLSAWLRFHLTAQLSWNFDKDEDNIFAGGKKDIASLYEYWVFFVLFNTLTDKYGKLTNKDTNQWIEGLIVPNRFGLGLTLQEGQTRAFEFKYQEAKRPLNIKFYYNRPFVGGRVYENHKGAGSYSKSFRPDYTLSIWPAEISQNKAEETESIVHIHFDAKYKVDYSFTKEEKLEDIEQTSEGNTNILSEDEKQQKEEQKASELVSAIEKEEKEGNYKNIDLYKMHAYKDAIRRSGGAYILYPGKTESKTNFQGFHEIIPGVGAFALRPNNEKDSSANISKFIDQVIQNLEDVLSQRERMARSAEKVYKTKPHLKLPDSKLDQLLRELGAKENPEENYVLIGYYKGKKHLDWIEENLKYNVRYGSSFAINGQMISAKYLILYGNQDMQHTYIYPINTTEGRIYSNKELLEIKPNKYPSKPTADQYFIFELGKRIDLDNFKFDLTHEILQTKLEELEQTKRPFTINMMELAAVRSIAP